MRFVSYAELKSRYGIRWTRKHVLELIRLGLFPAPVDLGGNTVAWVDTELDDWSAARVAARDNPSPETVAARKARSQTHRQIVQAWRRRKAEAARLARIAAEGKPKRLASKPRKRTKQSANEVANTA